MSVKLVRGGLVLPDRLVTDGLLVLENGRIREVLDLTAGAVGTAAGGALPAAVPGWLVPGFVDTHVHGGFGGDFSDGDPAADESICAGHLRHGTTSLLATTLTLSPAATLRALKAAAAARVWAPGADVARAGSSAGAPVGARILGFHVEGPFINPERKGAQDPAYIRPPNLAEFEQWHAVCPSCAWVLTVAPEVPGALAFIRAASDAGAVVSVGHTGASLEETAQAVAAGARSVTHLFNGMPSMHHRTPGVVGAALTLPINTEMIADGHHIHPALLEMVVRAKGVDHITLMTDAVAATGMSDGDYMLGGLAIRVQHGVARLAEGGNLAGSTLTMDRAVANMVQLAGVDLVSAVRMATLNPARLIGLDGELGSLAPGKVADVVHLGPDLTVRRVFQAGRVVHEAG